MTYQAGQRVELVHTSDPYTRLRPGARGTVTHHVPDLHTVHIAWDDGSTLAMLLDAGDRIRIINDQPSPGNQPDAPDAGREQPLDLARRDGARAGQAAADWWAQDTIGGRATGDVKTTARRVLAGLDDGDPAVLDTLPDVHLNLTGDQGESPHLVDEAAWARLTPQQRDEVGDTYLDAARTALHDRVAELCRTALHPTGDGRDLSHLHPDNLDVGGVGVFAGDWARTPGPDGQSRFPIGFVGTLAGRWNGWAVFTCTREVAEAIVADHHEHRERYRRYVEDGAPPGSGWTARSTRRWECCASTATPSSPTSGPCRTTRTIARIEPTTTAATRCWAGPGPGRRWTRTTATASSATCPPPTDNHTVAAG